MGHGCRLHDCFSWVGITDPLMADFPDQCTTTVAPPVGTVSIVPPSWSGSQLICHNLMEKCKEGVGLVVFLPPWPATQMILLYITVVSHWCFLTTSIHAGVSSYSNFDIYLTLYETNCFHPFHPRISIDILHPIEHAFLSLDGVPSGMDAEFSVSVFNCFNYLDTHYLVLFSWADILFSFFVLISYHYNCVQTFLN